MTTARQEHLECVVVMVRPDQLALQDKPDPLEHPVQADQLGIRDHRETLAHRGLEEKLDQQETRARMGHRVQPDPRDRKVFPDSSDSQGVKDRQDHRANRVQKAT